MNKDATANLQAVTLQQLNAAIEVAPMQRSMSAETGVTLANAQITQIRFGNIAFYVPALSFNMTLSKEVGENGQLFSFQWPNLQLNYRGSFLIIQDGKYIGEITSSRADNSLNFITRVALTSGSYVLTRSLIIGY